MNNGWIKIHRKMFDNPWLRKPNYLSVWMWILCHTEHGMKKVSGVWVKKEEKEMPSVLFKGERRHLKRGEFTCGAYRISKDTFVPRGSVERILKCFENEEQIEVLKSSKFSLGKVINWDKYQLSEEVSEDTDEELVRNKRGTGEDVTKKINNIKNVNNERERKKTHSQKYDFKICSSYKEVLEKNNWLPRPFINGQWSELEQQFGTEETLALVGGGEFNVQKVKAKLQAAMSKMKYEYHDQLKQTAKKLDGSEFAII